MRKFLCQTGKFILGPQITALFFVLAFFLAGCGGVTPVAPIPSQSPTQSHIPELPTSTPVITENSSSIITAENIKYISEIKKIGIGYIRNSGLSPDGELVYLVTATGVYLYKSDTFELLKQLDGNQITFSQDGKLFAITTAVRSELYLTFELKLIRSFDSQTIIFSSNGQYLVVPRQSSIAIYGSNYSPLVGDRFGSGENFSFSSDGQFIAQVIGKSINILDAKTLQPIREFPSSVDFGVPAQWIKNDKYLVLIGGISRAETDGIGSGITVLDATNGQMVYQKILLGAWIRPIYQEVKDNQQLLVILPYYWDKDLPDSTNTVISLTVVDLITKKSKDFFIDRQAQLHESNEIELADIAPDGSLVATRQSGAVTFWKFTDQLTQDIVLHGVKNINFSPNRETFLAFLPDGKVELRDNISKEKICEVQAFMADENPETNVSFATDGKKALLYSQSQNEFKVLDIPECAIQASLFSPYFGYKLSFNVDSSLIALAGGALPQVYDLKKNRMLSQSAPIIPYQQIYDISFHPTQKDLLLAGGGTRSSNQKGGFVYLWNLTSQTRTGYQRLQETVKTTFFSKDNLVATNEYFSKTTLWKANPELVRISELEKGEQILSPDGRYAAIRKNFFLTLFDLSSNKFLKLLDGRFKNSPVFSQDGNFFAYAISDQITIWDITKGQVVSEFVIPSIPNDKPDITGIVFHPNNQVLAICRNDGTITFVNVTQQKVLKTLEISGIHDFSFSPDGRWFAVLNNNGTLSLWGIP